MLAALPAGALGTPVGRKRGLSARAPEQVAAERADALAELARLDVVLSNLVAFIERGEAPESVRSTIKAREAERRDIKARLEHLDGVVKAATADRVTVEELRGIVRDWHGYLAQKPEAGQQALRKLLAGPIVVTWRPDGRVEHQGSGQVRQGVRDCTRPGARAGVGRHRALERSGRCRRPG